MKSGFVSIIGRQNVGKSTLINTIIGEKIAITTEKPQTTRNIIQGVYNEENVQIVFVDTPGIHKPVTKLGNFLNSQAYYSMNDVDIVLFIVDVQEEIGKGDMFVLEKLQTINKPVILLLNKIDKINNEGIIKKINQYKDLYDFAEIIPVSALKNDNISRLIKVIKNYLPDSVKYFSEEDKTSAPMDFRICEIVREKVFELTDKEIPYSVACILSDLEDKKDSVHISVDIIVDRDSLKKIIIGKKGIMLKEIGIKSRNDLEKMFNKKVYIELYVKTIKKWRNKENKLRELGYK